MANWYSGDHYQLDAIEVGDQQLSKHAVERLVRAMASFDGDLANNDEPSSMPVPVQATLTDYWAVKS